jgi:hypothetical protein
VFDISQTEGEPLPDLDTEATGDAGDLVNQLTDAADELGVTVRIIPADEWTRRGEGNLRAAESRRYAAACRGSTPAGPRSTSQPGSQTIPRSFANDLDERSSVDWRN